MFRALVACWLRFETETAKVRSPSAAAIYYQLFLGQFTRPIQEGILKLMAIVAVPTFLCEIDAASGNDKLFHHVLHSWGGARTLWEGKVCHLHQNNLVVTGLVQHLGGRVVSCLFSLAVVLRAFGYYLRMQQSLKSVVTKMCDPSFRTAAPPDPAACAYNAEVIHYILCNRHFEVANKADQVDKDEDDEWTSIIRPFALLASCTRLPFVCMCMCRCVRADGRAHVSARILHLGITEVAQP